jgi:hypothetical protein
MHRAKAIHRWVEQEACLWSVYVCVRVCETKERQENWRAGEPAKSQELEEAKSARKKHTIPANQKRESNSRGPRYLRVRVL